MVTRNERNERRAEHRNRRSILLTGLVLAAGLWMAWGFSEGAIQAADSPKGAAAGPSKATKGASQAEAKPKKETKSAPPKSAKSGGKNRQPNHPTVSLFDGKTLHGWTLEGDCKASVKDGSILLESGDGWLRSDSTYTNFVLTLETKALQTKNYDAGIFIRTLPGGKPFPKRSYQVNLQEGKIGNIGNIEGAVSQGLSKPAGEWNQFTIIVMKDTVRTIINERQAYAVAGLKEPKGHVGLQIEVPKGGQFLVRNIKIQELSHERLFDGKASGLSEWEGAEQPASLCWKMENDELLGLKSKGPWLRSLKEYDDFNLRLEFQVEPGANSGVYVRVPKDGNHHCDKNGKPAAGFEVQILDDHAPKHAKLKDYQYSGGVYDFVGPQQKMKRKPGEWNTLEINCKGHNVTTIQNGVRTAEVTPDKHPLIKVRQTKGYLGLQNHGGGVRFRNIRIGPAM